MESGAEVTGSVYGAYIADSGDNGLAGNNDVSISAGTVVNDVYGAYIGQGSGDARDNRVTISDGSDIRGDVFGAHVWNEAPNNSASITGGKVGGHIYGGYSVDGAAGGNSVSAEGATVGGHIYGGYSKYAATGNSAFVTGGTVTGDVVGGRSTDDAAIGNSATLDGGRVANLYGGSGNTEASGNSVTLYSGTVEKDVIGGHSSQANAPTINNTVTLYGGEIKGNLFGGSSPVDYDGNTLNLRGQAKAGQANHFQNFNIIVPANMAAGGTMLTVGIATNLATTSVIDCTFDPSGAIHYQSGDEITLIDKTTGDPFNKLYRNIARGVSSLYDVQVLTRGGSLMAVVDGKQANPQGETLSGPVLTGLTLLNLGADLVAGNALDQAWKSSRNSDVGGRWSYFSNFTYEDMTINDDIDVKGWSYLMGLAWRDGNDSDYGFLGGGFFEIGNADFDGSHSYAGVGRARYEGDVSYFGFGGLARYKMPNRLRLEASVRFGKIYSDYEAREYAGGQRPQYEIDTLYTGAHAGAGWDMNVTEKVNVDLSAKYFWVRQFGETVDVGDERLEFDDADSHRLKAGSRLTVMPHKHFDLYAGAYYEYEMGGSVDAKNLTPGAGPLHTMDLDDGASGLFELGVSILPDKNGVRDLVLDFMLTASTGRRDGFGGHFSLGWSF